MQTMEFIPWLCVWLTLRIMSLGSIFLEKLYDQVGYNGVEGLYFMSDRQKGVLNALDRVFPLSLKRY